LKANNSNRAVVLLKRMMLDNSTILLLASSLPFQLATAAAAPRLRWLKAGVLSAALRAPLA
jgi:hypothetical protein